MEEIDGEEIVGEVFCRRRKDLANFLIGVCCCCCCFWYEVEVCNDAKFPILCF